MTSESKLEAMAICLSRKHSPKWIAIKLNKRAMKWYRKKMYVKAASVFELAYRIDSTYATAIWNRASTAGLLNDASGTVLWLEKLKTLDTVKAIKYLRWLHKDKDFDSIREDPAFKSFFAIVKNLTMVTFRPGELDRLFPLGASFEYLLTSGDPEKKRKIVMKVTSTLVINGVTMVTLTMYHKGSILPNDFEEKWGMMAGPAYGISSSAVLLFSKRGVWLSLRQDVGSHYT